MDPPAGCLQQDTFEQWLVWISRDGGRHLFDCLRDAKISSEDVVGSQGGSPSIVKLAVDEAAALELADKDPHLLQHLITHPGTCCILKYLLNSYWCTLSCTLRVELASIWSTD